ncbi:MAG: hypothetical protein AUG74_03905 [Bacteroidetes bacterium 13_1_20CM_4_60_6]|nr:MAG: hypothetical protein AUG74_03905 [Bacteroidetes bacterium 13_1_20CM_4_60_6]
MDLLAGTKFSSRQATAITIPIFEGLGFRKVEPNFSVDVQGSLSTKFSLVSDAQAILKKRPASYFC